MTTRMLGHRLGIVAVIAAGLSTPIVAQSDEIPDPARTAAVAADAAYVRGL